MTSFYLFFNLIISGWTLGGGAAQKKKNLMQLHGK
jgi:hypothetical protein